MADDGDALAAAGEALGDGFDRLVRGTGTDPAALAASVRTIVAALLEV